MRIVICLAAVVLALSACGGDPGLSTAVAGELQDEVGAVRSAAEEGDADGAQAALEELRAAVDRGVQAGEIDAERARQILAAAADVEGRLEDLAVEEVEVIENDDDDVDDDDAGEADEEDTKDTKDTSEDEDD